jgi:hypothetical protein
LNNTQFTKNPSAIVLVPDKFIVKEPLLHTTFETYTPAKSFVEEIDKTVDVEETKLLVIVTELEVLGIIALPLGKF